MLGGQGGEMGREKWEGRGEKGQQGWEGGKATGRDQEDETRHSLVEETAAGSCARGK